MSGEDKKMYCTWDKQPEKMTPLWVSCCNYNSGIGTRMAMAAGMIMSAIVSINLY